jgi:hypothetical protein|tara:strand:+ start:867 stop:1304 length:438 start_codon:yes stop_codon:yes gene_type:complete
MTPMIRLAIENDFDEVKEIFYKHRKWFPHVRTDYMKRMINKKNLILQDGVLIIFHHTKRKQKIGDVQVEKDETVLHQIANKEIGNGKAKKVLLEFFEWCPRNVYLSVRSDNLSACKFYDRMDMKLVGIHNWVNGTLKGKVYAKLK